MRLSGLEALGTRGGAEDQRGEETKWCVFGVSGHGFGFSEPEMVRWVGVHGGVLGIMWA